ncbi:hypothetical protein C8J57DRAFT_1219149 [Mycena rebaudengoi]|nr:hypothetical protein C8J57DRAFT_1219149 [Mycena rebaudengoi]
MYFIIRCGDEDKEGQSEDKSDSKGGNSIRSLVKCCYGGAPATPPILHQGSRKHAQSQERKISRQWSIEYETQIEISKEEQLCNLNPIGAGTAAAWTMSVRRGAGTFILPAPLATADAVSFHQITMVVSLSYLLRCFRTACLGVCLRA